MTKLSRRHLHLALASAAVLAVGTNAARATAPVTTAGTATEPPAGYWSGSRAADNRRTNMLALLARENRLDPQGVDVQKLASAFDSLDPAARAAAEKALSQAALGWLARRRGETGLADRNLAAKAFAVLGDGLPISDLDLAKLELEVIEGAGGWVRVGTLPSGPPGIAPVDVVSPEVDVAPSGPMRQPAPDPEPDTLRRRLVQSMDLPARYLTGTGMDQPLKDALLRFQGRNGLLIDGVAGRRTMSTLNEPIADQIRRVALNLGRQPGPERNGLERYIAVNVPAFELKLVEHGNTVLQAKAIVGDEENPTPIFDDHMRYIELNPSWYVPDSIVDEVLKNEKRKPGYLEQNRFVWKNNGQTLVQQPGPKNVLGKFKFLFPNHHAVYIHDTSQRGLFARNDRTLSHGCIRVQDPMTLAVALIGPEGWDEQRIRTALKPGKTRRIDIASPVPVFIDYRTASIDSDGRLLLYPDIYEYDRNGIADPRGVTAPTYKPKNTDGRRTPRESNPLYEAYDPNRPGGSTAPQNVYEAYDPNAAAGSRTSATN